MSKEQEAREVGDLIEVVSEYIGLTHDAPWPKERQAARDALVKLGRLAFADRQVAAERERCAEVVDAFPTPETPLSRSEIAARDQAIAASIRQLGEGEG